MPGESKKQRELRYARRLVTALHLDAEPNECEQPDILLTLHDGTVVGLEVRELADEGVAASSSAMGRLERVAERKLGDLPAFVFVCWRTGPSIPLDSSSIDELAEELAAAVVQARSDGVEEIAGARLASFGVLNRHADTVVVTEQADPAAGPEVDASSQTHRAHGSPDVVQHALDEKEEKLAEYRRRASCAQWLLLVSGDRPAHLFLPGMLRPGARFRSSFDRVFALDDAPGGVRELEVAQVAKAMREVSGKEEP